MEPVAGTSNENPSIDFIVSRKGKVLLVHENRIYRKFKSYKTTQNVLWRCVLRPCSGYLTTDIKKDVIKLTDHSCGAAMTSSEIEIKKAVRDLQQEAEVTDAPLPTLYKNKVNDLLDQGHNFAGFCPNFKNIKSSLYNKRNKACGVDRLCAKTPGDVQVPKQYLKFLLADYNDGKSRILLFATERAREELAVTHHFYCDGTFKIAPKPFRQIYTIHGDIEGSVKPLAFAMLLDKKKSTYKKLFQLLKSAVPAIELTSLTSDFEEAAVRGILSAFPKVEVKGCYFHFKKAIKKKAKELGLNENSILRKYVALCAVLPHMPPQSLDEAWLYVMSESPKDSKVTQFNDYFISQWLDHRFWSNKFSCYGEAHKTNNHPETYYSILNKAVNKNGSKNLAMILRVLFGRLRQSSAAPTPAAVRGTTSQHFATDLHHARARTP